MPRNPRLNYLNPFRIGKQPVEFGAMITFGTRALPYPAVASSGKMVRCLVLILRHASSMLMKSPRAIFAGTNSHGAILSFGPHVQFA